WLVGLAPRPGARCLGARPRPVLALGRLESLIVSRMASLEQTVHLSANFQQNLAGAADPSFFSTGSAWHRQRALRQHQLQRQPGPFRLAMDQTDRAAHELELGQRPLEGAKLTFVF